MSEIAYYCLSVATLAKSEDSVSFWLTKRLCTVEWFCHGCIMHTASSAAVERTFSTAGESTRGRRNRLSNENLEKVQF